MKSDSHKEKNFLDFMNPNSLQVITAYVGQVLVLLKLGSISVSTSGFFAVDKDSSTSKLVFNNKTGLRWEEKEKKILML
jgi:glutaminyl-tRNA synthetase